MKKYFGLFTLILLSILCSCSKINTSEPSYKSVQLSLLAYNDNVTRTQLDDDSQSILWSPFDSISLFWSDWSSSKFVSESDTASVTTRFKGTIEIISGDSEAGDLSSLKFMAVYPYRDDNTSDGQNVTFDIDSIQYAVENSLPSAAFPAMATGTNLNLKFYNVCGGLAFSLTNDDIKYIKISSNDETPLAGRVKASFDNEGHPEVNDVIVPSNTIFLYAPEGGTFEAGVYYYAAAMPNTFDNGVSFTFYTETTKADTLIAGPKQIKRNVFAKLSEIDKDLVFPIKVTSVLLDITSSKLEIGKELQLTPTILPQDATNKNIIWSSSADTVATVTQEGLVTAVGEGTCIITAKSEDDPNIFATCTIKSGAVVHLTPGGVGHANCFIVSDAGKYDFDAVRGVSGQSLGNAATAEVLWEYISNKTKAKVGSLITDVSISEGTVLFETAEPMVSGNAVIAVRDDKGLILWSWHIWMAEGYDIDATSKLTSTGKRLMDRHLGSISGKKPIPNALFYQWGRKDPFPPDQNPSTYSSVEWPAMVQSTSSNGTIAYVTANPMQYLTGASDKDWCCEAESVKKVRWSDSQKTDYDPCPYGWRLPNGGKNGVWAKSITSLVTNWDSYNMGFEMSDNLGWYQCTGYLNFKGTLINQYSQTELWTSTYFPKSIGYSFSANQFFTDLEPSTSQYCSCGSCVRCVKE